VTSWLRRSVSEFEGVSWVGDVGPGLTGEDGADDASGQAGERRVRSWNGARPIGPLMAEVGGVGEFEVWGEARARGLGWLRLGRQCTRLCSRTGPIAWPKVCPTGSSLLGPIEWVALINQNVKPNPKEQRIPRSSQNGLPAAFASPT